MLIKTEMCTVVVQTQNVQPTGTESIYIKQILTQSHAVRNLLARPSMLELDADLIMSHAS